MIKEEFEWSKVGQSIIAVTDIIIIGKGIDERSKFFPSIFHNTNCLVITLNEISNLINLEVSKNNEIIETNNIKTVPDLAAFLSRYIDSTVAVTVDISSLQHHLLMYLCKLIIDSYKPRLFFACYAEPKEYANKSYLGEFTLSNGSPGISPVPGFSRRTKKDVHLIALLGFEGNRLTKIIEDKKFTKITPVIGFPSFQPGWHSRTLQNCMQAIQDANATMNIQRCLAGSIFGAYLKIQQLNNSNNTLQLAIAPLGTRPHSVACALYATKNPDTLIIYDYPVEITPRSTGISTCLGYNLSPFIDR
ncbi:MAG: hypothetical protein PHU66_09260 [Bacteroidaceae bacterium]|nr:hypothetical protein [Bacteroidaceae bacterium]